MLIKNLFERKKRTSKKIKVNRDFFEMLVESKENAYREYREHFDHMKKRIDQLESKLCFASIRMELMETMLKDAVNKYPQLKEMFGGEWYGGIESDFCFDERIKDAEAFIMEKPRTERDSIKNEALEYWKTHIEA